MLVAHDGERWLPEVLTALAASTARPRRTIAVDTGSTDGTGRLLAAATGEVVDRVVPTGRTVGFGAAVPRRWPPSRTRRAARPPGSGCCTTTARRSPTALAALLAHAADSPSAGPARRQGPRLGRPAGARRGRRDDRPGRSPRDRPRAAASRTRASTTGCATCSPSAPPGHWSAATSGTRSAGWTRRCRCSATSSTSAGGSTRRPPGGGGARGRGAARPRGHDRPAPAARRARPARRGRPAGGAARAARARAGVAAAAAGAAPAARHRPARRRLPADPPAGARARRGEGGRGLGAAAARPAARGRAGAGGRDAHGPGAATCARCSPRRRARARARCEALAAGSAAASTAGVLGGVGAATVLRPPTASGGAADAFDADEPAAGGLLARLLLRPAVLLTLALLAVALVAERDVLVHRSAGCWPAAGCCRRPVAPATSGPRTPRAGTRSPSGSAAPAPPALAVLGALATVLLGKAWLAVDVVLLGQHPAGGRGRLRRDRRPGARAALARAGRSPAAVGGGHLGAAARSRPARSPPGRLDAAVAQVGLPLLLPGRRRGCCRATRRRRAGGGPGASGWASRSWPPSRRCSGRSSPSPRCVGLCAAAARRPAALRAGRRRGARPRRPGRPAAAVVGRLLTRRDACCTVRAGSRAASPTRTCRAGTSPALARAARACPRPGSRPGWCWPRSAARCARGGARSRSAAGCWPRRARRCRCCSPGSRRSRHGGGSSGAGLARPAAPGRGGRAAHRRVRRRAGRPRPAGLGRPSAGGRSPQGPSRSWPHCCRWLPARRWSAAAPTSPLERGRGPALPAFVRSELATRPGLRVLDLRGSAGRVTYSLQDAGGLRLGDGGHPAGRGPGPAARRRRRRPARPRRLRRRGRPGHPRRRLRRAAGRPRRGAARRRAGRAARPGAPGRRGGAALGGHRPRRAPDGAAARQPAAPRCPVRAGRPPARPAGRPSAAPCRPGRAAGCWCSARPPTPAGGPPSTAGPCPGGRPGAGPRPSPCRPRAAACTSGTPRVRRRAVLVLQLVGLLVVAVLAGPGAGRRTGLEREPAGRHVRRRSAR